MATVRWFAITCVAVWLAGACKSRDTSDKKPQPPDKPATKGPGADTPIDGAATGGDPMFPTQTTAGTKQIFFLEEPDRGRHITAAKMPPLKGAKWTRHAYCELGAVTLACSKAKPRKGDDHWRLTTRGTTTVAERWRGNRAAGRLLLERNKAGALTAVIALRVDGMVDWARSYEQPGIRYSERALSGANQLDGCGFMKANKDAKGTVTSVTCLQWLLAPMADARGVATEQLQRDSAGFVIERRRMDTAGKPVAGHDGVHRVTIARDAAGRPEERRYFGVDGTPVSSSHGGCSGERITYDDKGREIMWTSLDPSGRPMAGRPDALKKYHNDARGCRVRESRFDHQLAPSALDGVHTERSTVDDQCRPRSVVCHDTKGKRTACGPGRPAEIRLQRNTAGRIVRRRHYDAGGKPAGDAEMGVFERRHAYDDKGNRVESSCWNEDGAPIECSRTGYHASLGTFDHVGRRVSTRFLDTERKPASNVGTVVRRDKYDNYDHLHTTESVGDDGKPLEALGAASRRYLYDPGHRLFGVVLYDALGKPARYRGCFTGRTCPSGPWHAVRVVRDDTGRVVRNLFFDHKRMLIHTYECKRAQCFGR